MKSDKRQLEQVVVQEYWFNDELLAPISSVFLLFERWLRVTVSDGTLHLEWIEPQNENVTDFGEFTTRFKKQTLDSKHRSLKYIGQSLQSVSEIVWINSTGHEFQCGAMFNFETGSLVVIEHISDDDSDYGTLEITTSNERLQDLLIRPWHLPKNVQPR